MKATHLIRACALVALVVSFLASEGFAQTALVREGQEWSFFRGLSEPPAEWKDLEFDVIGNNWDSGPTGIGYGDDDDATILDDMQGSYSSVYLRIRFNVPDELDGGRFVLRARWDDSFVAYVDGEEIARRGVDGSPPTFDTLAFEQHEITGAGFDEDFLLSGAMRALESGPHVLAVQVHNATLDSSDLSFSCELIGAPFIATHVDPAFGPVDGGNEVRIVGSGFDINDTPTVHFGDEASTDVGVASTFLIVQVPPAAQGGTVDVTIEDTRGRFVLENAYRYAGGGQTGLLFDGGEFAQATGFAETLEEGTIEAWFNWSGGGFLGGIFRTTLISFQAPGGGDAFRLEIRGDGLRASTTVDGETVELLGPADVSTNTWHHIAYAFSVNGRALYFNGQLVGQDNFTFEHIDVDLIRIGHASEQALNFSGIIESAAIYPFERRAVEIRQERFTPLTERDDLFAAWPLAEGAGDTSADVGEGDFELTLGSGFGPDDDDPEWVAIEDFPTLAISSIDPPRGSIDGGEEISIFGGGFPTTGETTVLFGNVASPEVEVVSSSQIRATTPPSEFFRRVSVTVETRRGSFTLENAFTYQPGAVYPLVEEGDIWHYHVPEFAVAEDWTSPAFDPDASGWQSGPSGLGYGDDDDATIVDNLENLNVTLYARTEFELSGDGSKVNFLRLRIRYDDGFVAYLNGVEIARRNVDGNPPAFDEPASDLHEITGGEGVFDEAIDVSTRTRQLRAGKNVLAIEVHNNSIDSSDLSLSAELEYSAPGRTFVRGDVDNNGRHDVTDAVLIMLDIIGQTSIDCREAGDVNNDGRSAVDDLVFLLEYVFRQGPLPAAPLFAAGPDLDADALDCGNTQP